MGVFVLAIYGDIQPYGTIKFAYREKITGLTMYVYTCFLCAHNIMITRVLMVGWVEWHLHPWKLLLKPCHFRAPSGDIQPHTIAIKQAHTSDRIEAGEGNGNGIGTY